MNFDARRAVAILFKAEHSFMRQCWLRATWVRCTASVGIDEFSVNVFYSISRSRSGLIWEENIFGSGSDGIVESRVGVKIPCKTQINRNWKSSGTNACSRIGKPFWTRMVLVFGERFSNKFWIFSAFSGLLPPPLSLFLSFLFSTLLSLTYYLYPSSSHTQLLSSDSWTNRNFVEFLRC